MLERCRDAPKGNHETATRLRAKIGAVFRYATASGVVGHDPTFALRGPRSELEVIRNTTLDSLGRRRMR